MNREIKFRGKNKKHGFIDGYYFVNRDEHFIVQDGIVQNPLATYEDYIVDEETIGQFTGKTDKSRKEIYEGDLIKSPSGRIYAVVFGTWKHEEKRTLPKVIDLYEHHGWCISLDGVTPCELLDSEVCEGYVIGNIHNTPELLKGGQQ